MPAALPRVEDATVVKRADEGVGRDLLGPTRRTVRLTGDVGAPAAARLLVRETLTDAGRPDCVPEAELACTELVTNVLLHAHTDLDLTVEVTDRVRVAVRDFNPTLPLQRHYDVDATTGRGLGLVAMVSDEYGVADAGPGGKTLWFTTGTPVGQRPQGAPRADWDSASWDLDGLAVPSARSTATTTTTVRLLGLPSALWLVARQHHDAILRELAFYRTRHDVAVDLVAADRARFLVSNAAVAAIESTRGTDVPASTPLGPEAGSPASGPASLDLELQLPPDAGADVAALQHALDVAEHLARAGKLLTRPGRTDVVAVRTWACDQVRAQLAGAPPAPWTGTSSSTAP
ncbi:ATP-binding protein [Cellulomonas aerilata]|uniref:Histidine kinase/HSP90-like ATPase domain-containing protein n=1 Tax=Cellulomonas aerilata TaxID=515326 RepID=A0A512DCD8_9CELL|nr:ATP-binding protein [Cellulomonas aerilata]GEO34149.1 hypothetical protein CAE01nite_18740 [Cellulomonas aerilata]